MKATNQLKEEHQGVLLMLEVFQAIGEKLSKGEEVPLEHLQQILEFLQVFVDQCHHAKEEEVLFPALEKSGIPKEGGLLGVMLEEHAMGRGYIQGLVEGVKEYSRGKKEGVLKIQQNAQGYINLLREHIGKEDNILYPLADSILGDEEQEKLAEDFESIEKNKIGEGKHDEFHQMLETLKKTYIL